MMTAKQYRAALTKLTMTQVGLAKLLRVSDVTSRRWARLGVKGPAAILVKLLASGKISKKDIEEARR